jgi:hypothetical protein
VERVRFEEPTAYLKVIASILPRELTVNSNPLEMLNDGELQTLTDVIEALIAGRPAVSETETAGGLLANH